MLAIDDELLFSRNNSSGAVALNHRLGQSQVFYVRAHIAIIPTGLTPNSSEKYLTIFVHPAMATNSV